MQSAYSKFEITISECCILKQKEYKRRHDWVGKVIHWELCKNFKFDKTKRWYIQNPDSVPENETYKLLWDFEIQTGHIFSLRRPDLIIINKKKKKKKERKRSFCVVYFAVLVDHRVKLKESKKKKKKKKRKVKYLDLVRELKKLCDIKVILKFWYVINPNYQTKQTYFLTHETLPFVMLNICFNLFKIRCTDNKWFSVNDNIYRSIGTQMLN